MDNGEVIALDTPDALKTDVGGDIVEIRTADNEKRKPKWRRIMRLT